MTDLFLRFLISQPQRLTLIGRVLYRCAAFQVLAGVVAQVLTFAMREAQPQIAYRGISDVVPGLPTWWIPETVLGMIGVTLFAAVGLAIAYSGRQVERQWI
ncbi:MAG: hypothetical protein ABI277_00250 [Burkholderiaceae bacterium]